MKTRDEIYKNLYERSVYSLKRERGLFETLFIFFCLIFLLTFVFVSIGINNLSLISFAFFYLPLGGCLADKGKCITNISKNKIAEKLKIVFDQEIEAAKESNFSCEEKIRELEEMRAALCN